MGQPVGSTRADQNSVVAAFLTLLQHIAMLCILAVTSCEPSACIQPHALSCCTKSPVYLVTVKLQWPASKVLNLGVATILKSSLTGAAL